MTLTDTGPLIALLNRNDPNHAICIAAAQRLPSGPLVTTWPCFTEAMYLLHRVGGYTAQASLWRMRTNGRLVLHESDTVESDRMAELMNAYRDRPMDLADASLIAAANQLGAKQLFTLDGDFRIYRLADGTTLEMIPQ